ncbi:MAG: hypothetical protein MHPSP_002972 [Paramarteilia canceri]
MGILPAQANAVYMIDNGMYDLNKFNGKILQKLRNKYLISASQLTHIPSLIILADDLLTGKNGFATNKTKAAEILKYLAEKHNNSEANYKLGKMFQKGQVFAKDLELSYKYMENALNAHNNSNLLIEIELNLIRLQRLMTKYPSRSVFKVSVIVLLGLMCLVIKMIL